MKSLTLLRIAEVCGGIFHAAPGHEEDANTEVVDIVTDSRIAKEGSLFAAIRGERSDGHDYIPAVYSQGALCVLSEKELEGEQGNWIKVDSTLQALKDIAEEYRRVLDIPVVGVTGSVGKTSTKEFVHGVLAQKYSALKTAGNFNNELGLPLTVFRLREEEIAVLEMGINHFGEMHRLAKIARPDTCLITNIGQCHLEFLGDRDGVLRAKSEIFDFAGPKTHIVLNGCDDKLATVKEIKGIIPSFFGFPESACVSHLDVWADEVTSCGLKGSSCRIHTPEGSFSVHVPVPGRHMVLNALAAVAVGRLYGVSHEQMKAGIEGLEAVGGRLHIIETEKYEIIDDCYNANPVSLKASLDVLHQADRCRIAVVGDMGELGSGAEQMHRECGAYAARAGLSILVGIGPLCASLIEAAEEEDPSLDVRHYDTVDDFLTHLDEIPGQSTVLVKASHAMGFARIVQALEDRA